MEKITNYSRRDFVKIAAVTSASLWLPFLKAPQADASPNTIALNEPFVESPIEALPPTPINLQTYLSSIRQDQERLREVVEENDIFEGFKHFTPEQRVEDFDIYFPIYLAGDLKYQIPWPLLWIMHAAETAISRNSEPNQGKQVGAMQINSDYNYLEEATVGWEFLRNLPDQRYPDDWKELLKGALYIRNKADEIKDLYYPKLSDENGILNVVKYRYSASEFGIARANQYLRIKALFD